MNDDAAWNAPCLLFLLLFRLLPVLRREIRQARTEENVLGTAGAAQPRPHPAPPSGAVLRLLSGLSIRSQLQQRDARLAGLGRAG